MLGNLFRRDKSLISSGILEGKIDRHSHILFGVDDGIKTLDDSLAVLSFLEGLGLKELWCTPHIMEEVPNQTALLKERFNQLKEAYRGPIELHLGAEYMIDLLLEQRLEAGDLIVGEDGLLMLETYSNNPIQNIYEIFRQVQRLGYKPLLAHPERYRYLDEAGYNLLHDMGVAFQLNLPSLTGYYGESAKTKAIMLLKKGWYNCFGSDCHSLPALKKQLEQTVITKEMIDRLAQL